MNVFYQPRLREGINSLEGDEAHHLRVLRLSAGDAILVTDGKGLFCEAVISDSGFRITKKVEVPRLSSIHLFVAPTKNSDRIEWLVEKATEIGVSSITMMQCERNERKHINHDRLVRNSISAMKQSQQAWLPDINPLTNFDQVVKNGFDQKFIAYVDQANPDHLKDLAKPRKSYGVLIGPEGDFTEAEIRLAIDNNWKKVSLGPTRLRTETAALLAVVLLNNLES